MSNKPIIIIHELPWAGDEYKKLLKTLFKKSAKDFIQYSPVTILSILVVASFIALSLIIHPVTSIFLSYLVGFKLVTYYSYKKTGLQFPYMKPMLYYFYQVTKYFIFINAAVAIFVLLETIYYRDNVFNIVSLFTYLAVLSIMIGIMFIDLSTENIQQSIFLLVFDINFLMNSLGIQNASEASKIALISYKLNKIIYLKFAIYLMFNIIIATIVMILFDFANITFLIPTLMFSVMFIFNMYLLRNIHQEIYDVGQKEKETENATSKVATLDYALGI